MKITIFTLGFLILISCHSNDLHNKIESLKKQHLKDSLYTDSLKKKLYYYFTSFGRKQDTLFKTYGNEVYVIGDSTNNKINDILIKFQPLIYFSDFKVDSIYKGPKAPIILKSNNLGPNFKTIITTTYKNHKVDFAGHYVFVQWGCGSPCIISVIVDAKTGKIYNGIPSSWGYYYKINSRMIIVNRLDSAGYYMNCASCKPEIYIFDENKKKFISRN